MSLKLRIGQTLRYAKPRDAYPERVDGLVNFHHIADSPVGGALQLERGINTPASTKGPDGVARRAAILISSSPHKKGTLETPWQDHFDPDNGHIRYFGDNKDPGNDPTQSLGNRELLRAFQFAHHHDKETREQTPPLLFFRRVTHQGKSKGFPQFEGFGIITSAELITQWDNKQGHSFSNYVFDFTVFSVAKEHEEFDWRWIDARRDKTKSLADTLEFAPDSWKTWLKEGPNALPKIRRRVAKLNLVPTEDQKPEKGSELEKALKTIYEYYAGKKHHFESLAELVAEKALGADSASYHQGWVTSAGGDGGADFIARLEIGSDVAKTKLVVLGQAKCEKPTTPTNGNHIARTVARLRRGWIGVYVTTSYFSLAVQEEVIQDRYPISLINGKRVAQEVLKIVHDSDDFDSVTAFLDHLSENHQSRISSRDPEEVLFVP